MFVGSSGVDRVFLAGAAAQVGVRLITRATGRGVAIWGAGRSADMSRVLSVSYGDRPAPPVQGGVISGARGGGVAICDGGKSVNMLKVFAASFGGHRAISDFGA